MSPDPSAEPKMRLFVALDLPEAVREGLVAWGARELSDEALRPVAPESLHLTLCFVGWTEADRVPEAAALVRGIEPRPVPMALRRDPVGKPPRRPGLYALDVDSPAAGELQAELAAGLANAGLYRPEKRPFWPHVTVARVRRERGGRRRPRRVAARPGPLPQALARTFDSVRVALYRSNLRPQGAQYTSLANLDLPPAT